MQKQEARKPSNRAPPIDNKPLLNESRKETALPAALNTAQGKPSRVSRQAAPAKQVVPHPAEPLSVSQPYSAFESPQMIPVPSGTTTGILESAKDTVLRPGASQPPASKNVSNQSSLPAKNPNTTGAIGEQPPTEVKRLSNFPKSEGSRGKNIPLKSQQIGRGRGYRSRGRGRDGRNEKNEQRVGIQANKQHVDQVNERERRKKQQPAQAKVMDTTKGNTVSDYPFTCQIVVKFTTANPGRKQEIVHEYHYNPLSASFI